MANDSAGYLVDLVALLAFTECTIEDELVDYLGVMGLVVDHREVLEATLDEFFYGRSLGRFNARQLLVGYGAPTEMAARLIDRLLEEIDATIKRTIGLMNATLEYSYKTMGSNTILIQRQKPYTEPMPERPTTVEEVNMNQIYGSDFYPEKLRQAAALFK